MRSSSSSGRRASNDSIPIAIERPPMGLEVALQRQNRDSALLLFDHPITRPPDHPIPPHHPRVCSCASSGRLAASIPFIPAPSDSSASTRAFASRQCVVALTIARARFSGSST